MSDDTFDPWAPSTGLVDAYTGKIVSAHFGTDAEYNNGQTTLLILEVKTDAAELADRDFIDTIKLSCGDGWVAKSKGAKVEREDGKSKGFNNQSAVWKFIAAAMEAGAGDEMRSRGTPYDAATFDGLEFEFERQSYTDMGGKDRSRMVPVKFLGAAKGKGKATEEDGATEKPAVNGAKVARLKVLAKECDTHDEFVERAFSEVDGVAGDGELEGWVMDPANFEAANA